MDIKSLFYFLAGWFMGFAFPHYTLLLLLLGKISNSYTMIGIAAGLLSRDVVDWILYDEVAEEGEKKEESI